MKPKELLQETLDIDHGFIATFLTLFSDPKRVVTHPEKYTKPWKYATYVVSISCLFTWVIIHSLLDSQDQSQFWSLSKRMLELSGGYERFYENTQPLKRLILGAAAFYTALLIFFFKERNQPPGYFIISLYVLGQSVFIVFLCQSLGVIVFRNYWTSNEVIYIGVAAHIIYLWYSTIRILGRPNWIWIIKGIAVMLVTFVLYAGVSTHLMHTLYFGIINNSKMPFRVEPDKTLGYTEEARDPKNSTRENPSGEYRHEVALDSFLITAECAHPGGQEVSKITLQCFSKSRVALLWSTVIFEKITRYSPNPGDVLLRVDSTSQTAFTFYRISNDSNATIQMTSVNIVTGHLNYKTTLDPAGDDVFANDAVIDSSFIYVCGKTQNKHDNFDLGTLFKLDKQTGKILSIKQLGSTAFASWTSFREMKMSDNKVIIVSRRDYKSFFLFYRTTWSVLTIDKQLL